jgi:hypothetical protein
MIGYVIRGEEEARKWYNGSMNSKEAAEFLGISRYMLRKLVKEDKIPYSKSYNNVMYHQTILNAWMRGEFIPGRVKLILDEETIGFDHEDAFREHYERYPELFEKDKIQRELSLSTVNSDYRFEMRQDGVLLYFGSSDGDVAFQAFLSNADVNMLIQSVQKYRLEQQK